MQLPNVRLRYDSRSAMFGKHEENVYYEGYLNADGKEALFWYDFAIHELETALENIIEADTCEDDDLGAEILDWMEEQRNDLVVTLIEGMDDEEYERIRAQVDKQGGEAQ